MILTFLVGAAGFLICQPLLRFSLLKLLGKTMWFSLLPYNHIVLYFIFMGLTAGIFEECTRWVGLKYFRRGHEAWKDGLVYGLGHGLSEVVWLFVVQMLPAIRSGQAGWGLAVGLWERVFTVMVHIGLTFVVLYGVRKHKSRWLLLAILLHGLVDFLIIIGNVWVLEALITAEGITALILVLRQRKKWDIRSEELI